jgi:hypothetical protein
MARTPGKRAEHQAALDRFVEREYDTLLLFDRVAEAAGVLTAGFSTVVNEFVVESKGSRTFQPITLDGPLMRSSLILTERFIETRTRIRDSYSSPGAEVPVGTRRSVQMGLESYPGMPEEITELGSRFYARPRLIVETDPAGELISVGLQPKTISPQRLPLAQFEQVAFRHLIDDAAATLGI